jgi:large subunit ribosomal protein L15
MTKLNELSPREGSVKARMRVGRGPGSGKGKTAGRGVKGQKSRTGVSIAGFEGGQMPLHMRLPKRGFNSINRKHFAEVNLWRLAQAIEAGKLDAKQVINADVLIAAGVIRRKKDGVRLLGTGTAPKGLQFDIHSASSGARKAIEDAGGKLTTVIAAFDPDAEVPAPTKGKKAEAAAKEAKAEAAKAKKAKPEA